MTVQKLTIQIGSAHTRTVFSNVSGTFFALNLPPGLTISSGGVISGIPTTPGTYASTVFCVFKKEVGVAVIDYTVTPIPAPIITSSDVVAPSETGLATSYQITAVSGPPITSYSVSNLFPGFSVDTQTGIVSGIPSINFNELPTFQHISRVSATSSAGTGFCDVLFTFRQRPVITSSLNNLVLDLNSPISMYTITATKSANLFGATGLPAGLTLNTSNGQITGTPTAFGNYSITLSAGNGVLTGTAALNILVVTLPIMSNGNSSGREDIAFSYQIVATGFPAVTSYGASGLPPGLSVNTSTGLISGIPSIPSQGSYTVTLQATNSLGTSSQTVTFTIAEAYGLFGQTVRGMAPSSTYGILFADADNSRIRTLSGAGGMLGTLNGAITNPWGVVETPNGKIYASENTLGSSRVRRWTGSSWVSVAGPYRDVNGICCDQSNSVYACVSDDVGGEVRGRVIKITDAGVVSDFLSHSSLMSAGYAYSAPHWPGPLNTRYGYVTVHDITPMMSGGVVQFFGISGAFEGSFSVGAFQRHIAYFLADPSGSTVAEVATIYSNPNWNVYAETYASFPFSGDWPATNTYNIAFVVEPGNGSWHINVTNGAPSASCLGGVVVNAPVFGGGYARGPASQPLTSSPPHTFYKSERTLYTAGDHLTSVTWAPHPNSSVCPVNTYETMTRLHAERNAVGGPQAGFRDGPLAP